MTQSAVCRHSSSFRSKGQGPTPLATSRGLPTNPRNCARGRRLPPPVSAGFSLTRGPTGSGDGVCPWRFRPLPAEGDGRNERPWLGGLPMFLMSCRVDSPHKMARMAPCGKSWGDASLLAREILLVPIRLLQASRLRSQRGSAPRSPLASLARSFAGERDPIAPNEGVRAQHAGPPG